MHKTVMIFIAIGCSPSLACEGSDDGDSMLADTTAATGASEASTGETAPTHAATGTVTSFVSGAAIEGASICVDTPAGSVCDETNASGEYELVVESDLEALVTITHPTHVPGAFTGTTGADDTNTDFLLLEQASGAIFATAVGTAMDPSLAHIALSVGAPEVSFSITPSSGVGPAYVDDSGLPSLDIPATAENGVGGWLNVAVGSIDVTASTPDGPCSPGDATIAGAAPNSARVDLVAGHYNGVLSSFDCG